MAIITRITTQKKNQGRYSIYIDNGSGEQFGFGVDEDVLIQFELRKGLKLDGNLIKKITYEDEVKKALHQCYSYLSYRMRSELEVKRHLQKKEIEEPIIYQVIEQLRKQKYVDDLAFAQSYVRDKKRLLTKGPLLLKKELQEKGVQEDKIGQALKEYAKHEQLEAASLFVTKRAARAHKDSNRMFLQKLKLQLQQKGFTHEVIQEAVDCLPERNDKNEYKILLKQAKRAHNRYKKYSGYDYTQRMKQYLYRRGFSLTDINDVLQHMQEAEKE